MSIIDVVMFTLGWVSFTALCWVLLGFLAMLISARTGSHRREPEIVVWGGIAFALVIAGVALDLWRKR